MTTLIIEEAQNYAENICQQSHVDDSHGLKHLLAVKNHLERCLKEDQLYHLDQETQTDLLLTAILHDIDDRKYFANSQNAQKFLESHLKSDRAQRILRWISYISTSKNGNHIPQEAIEYPWVLWPRYCDRIEAVGQVGVQRLIEYSRLNHLVDYVETTPKAKTSDEVIKLATPTRFEKYLHNNGLSDSVIDHIYDKLLHICNVETYSPYINDCLSSGKQILIEICLDYGHYGKLNC